MLKAIEVAKKAHAGQKRKVSGDPYFHHPVAVAFIVMSVKKSSKLTELVAAAILHDILEDTELTFAEISEMFGPFVAALVLELTNDEKEIALIGKKEYQKKKLLHMSSYGLLLKLADRYQNMSEHPTDQMKKDTEELMIELLEKRSTLTRAHRELISDIKKLC